MKIIKTTHNILFYVSIVKFRNSAECIIRGLNKSRVLLRLCIRVTGTRIFILYIHVFHVAHEFRDHNTYFTWYVNFVMTIKCI